MKKTVLKIAALVLVAVLVCSVLVSCGNTISGIYKTEINAIVGAYEVVYEFDGNDVKVTKQITTILGNSDPVVVEGEYEITEKADGSLQITFTYPAENEDEDIKGGTYDFEEGETYIKIGMIQYNKVSD